MCRVCAEGFLKSLSLDLIHQAGKRRTQWPGTRGVRSLSCLFIKFIRRKGEMPWYSSNRKAFLREAGQKATRIIDIGGPNTRRQCQEKRVSS